jgi:O-antigen/teichoic acid export membrane protein
VKRNLIASIAGTAVSGMVAVALVPLYVHFLGIEAFGLIAFHTSVTVVVTLLDLGFGAAVNREVARRGADDARGVVRSVQPLYAAIALGAGAALFLLAPWMATQWFSPRALPPETVTTTLRLLAGAVALRFPYGLYAAALMGAQRHVPLNGIVVAAAVLRAAAAVVLLAVLQADVRAVMSAELVIAGLQTLVAAALVYRFFPAAQTQARLQALWSFARSAAAIGILSGLVSQVDKLVVSKVLPLATFGGYAVAVTIGAIVMTAMQPFHAAAFPRLTQLAARGEHDGVARLYGRATRTMSAILFPLAVMAAFFMRELIVLWSGSFALAEEIHLAAVLVMAGSACYALTTLMYSLQLAHGWLTPPLVLNVASLCVLAPVSAWSAVRFGAAGPAATWFGVQAIVLAADVVTTHRRLLPGYSWIRDVAPPLLASLAVAILARLAIDALRPASATLLAALLGMSGMVALGAAALTAMRRSPAAPR